jgi:hypothetical protein
MFSLWWEHAAFLLCRRRDSLTHDPIRKPLGDKALWHPPRVDLLDAAEANV